MRAFLLALLVVNTVTALADPVLIWSRNLSDSVDTNLFLAAYGIDGSAVLTEGLPRRTFWVSPDGLTISELALFPFNQENSDEYQIVSLTSDQIVVRLLD